MKVCISAQKAAKFSMQNTPLINYGHLEGEIITKSEKFVGLHKIVEGAWVNFAVSKQKT